MALHSSTLAWKIPWTEEPGRLQSMGLLRVGHDWATSLWLFPFMHWRRKWQPSPVFLPGESQGQGSLVGCCLWGPHRVGHDWSDLAAAGRKVQNSCTMIYTIPYCWALRLCPLFSMTYNVVMNIFPSDANGKEPACQCRRHKRYWFDPWVGKIPWRRAWQPTPVFLPGESHGQRSPAGYGP